MNELGPNFEKLFDLPQVLVVRPSVRDHQDQPLLGARWDPGHYCPRVMDQLAWGTPESYFVLLQAKLPPVAERSKPELFWSFGSGVSIETREQVRAYVDEDEARSDDLWLRVGQHSIDWEAVLPYVRPNASVLPPWFSPGHKQHLLWQQNNMGLFKSQHVADVLRLFVLELMSPIERLAWVAQDWV